MLNYADWLRRAVEFIHPMKSLPGKVKVKTKVAAPLSDGKLRRVTQSCRLPIPRSLQRFWTEASAHCCCKYWWDTPTEFRQQLAVAFPNWPYAHIWGGADFESATSVVKLTKYALEHANASRDDYPMDARLWEHSLPLVPVGTGDYIGLYVRDTTDDPPIAYLCHEDCGGSTIIAANLDEFLSAWEQLNYIGIHFLMSFIDKKSGQLAPNTFPVEVEAVQTLLHGEARPDLQKPSQAMTEVEWLSSADPAAMLEWLEAAERMDPRKLQLFCCACCRRVWNRMGPWSRRAVEVAERFADGRASRAALDKARLGLRAGERGDQVQKGMFLVDVDHDMVAKGENPLKQGFPEDVLQSFAGAFDEAMAFSRSQGAMHDVAFAAVDASRFVSWQITQHLDEPELAQEKAAHAALIRHIFGNPFAKAIHSNFSDQTVLESAKRLYRGEGSAAELSEALNAAGEASLAAHFSRSDHPKGCWALDAILGR